MGIVIDDTEITLTASQLEAITELNEPIQDILGPFLKDTHEDVLSDGVVRDFNGDELAIGDEVIFISRHYRKFEIGVILRFTPKKAIVGYEGDCLGHLKINYTLEKDSRGEPSLVVTDSYIKDVKRSPKDLILTEKGKIK